MDWVEQEFFQTNLTNVTPHTNFQLGTWSSEFITETINLLSNLTKIGHAINLKMPNSHINPFTYLEGWNHPYSSLIIAYKPHQPISHRPSIRVVYLTQGSRCIDDVDPCERNSCSSGYNTQTQSLSKLFITTTRTRHQGLVTNWWRFGVFANSQELQHGQFT